MPQVRSLPSLPVDLDKPNAKARSKLLEAANNALVSIAFGSTNPKSEDKLGNLGLLSPNFYEIEIQNPLKSDLAENGLTKNEVQQAIRYPDSYQHLSPPPDFNSETSLISIFVRVLNREDVSQGAPVEWCLVNCRRDGRKVIAQDAYRISQKFLRDVHTTPLSLFKAFCEIFGCELVLGSKSIGKFLVYERIVGNGKIEARSPIGHSFKLSIMAKPNNNFIELAFGYAIDVSAYRKTLSVKV